MKENSLFPIGKCALDKYCVLGEKHPEIDLVAIHSQRPMCAGRVKHPGIDLVALYSHAGQCVLGE